MDKRNEIALIYIKSKAWMGGTYYVQNLISALAFLPDEQRPIINVVCEDKYEFNELEQITKYPYLSFSHQNWNRRLIVRIIEKILSLIYPFHFGSLQGFKISETRNKVIFPVISRVQVKDRTGALVWIPDFQEKYYSHLFSNADIKNRNKFCMCAIHNNVPIVFSSQNAQEDFFKFYPKAKNETYVLPFAVTLPDFSHENIEGLKRKYGITKKYFFCANQFWEHKNHLFLFEAFRKLKLLGGDFQLVCSGALKDYRNSNYANQIKSFLVENNMEDDIRILGFIERTEQLCLMEHSYSMIQPSLFEGWSTVVEDAKALNKFIFLSNLKVHLEQAPLNVCYFNPTDVEELVDKMLSVTPTQKFFDYSKNIVGFGDKFIRIVDRI